MVSALNLKLAGLLGLSLDGLASVRLVIVPNDVPRIEASYVVRQEHLDAIFARAAASLAEPVAAEPAAADGTVVTDATSMGDEAVHVVAGRVSAGQG